MTSIVGDGLFQYDFVKKKKKKKERKEKKINVKMLRKW